MRDSPWGLTLQHLPMLLSRGCCSLTRQSQMYQARATSVQATHVRTGSEEGEESGGGNAGKGTRPAGPLHSPEALETNRKAYSLPPLCGVTSSDTVWPSPSPVEFYWSTVTPSCLLSEVAPSGFMVSADTVATAALWPTESKNTSRPCSEAVGKHLCQCPHCGPRARRSMFKAAPQGVAEARQPYWTRCGSRRT